MITYLILKRVRVQHANAMVSWNVVGAPSVTAHVGFSKALAFHYGLDATAVAILHHGMDHEGRYSYGRLQPNRVRGVPLQVDSRRSKFALSDQPFALAHYEASLVVRLEGSEEDTRTFRDATLESDGNIFSQRIQTLFRFAGGPIVSVADILISDYRNEALEKLPRVGHFVIDASEEIHPRHEGEDSLDRAIDLIYPDFSLPSPFPDSVVPVEKSSGLESEGTSQENIQKRWLALSHVGYLQITDVAMRAGVRQSLPHAYAEPLLGLVEYLPYRRAIRRADLKPFWGFTHPAPDTIVAKSVS